MESGSIPDSFRPQLHLPYLKYTDRGEYHCVARNSLGTERSGSLLLNVSCASFCRIVVQMYQRDTAGISMIIKYSANQLFSRTAKINISLCCLTLCFLFLFLLCRRSQKHTRVDESSERHQRGLVCKPELQQPRLPSSQQVKHHLESAPCNFLYFPHFFSNAVIATSPCHAFVVALLF